MHARRLTSLIALLITLLALALPWAPEAAAQGAWYYRWELTFPFENTLDGTLTLFLKPPNNPIQTLTRTAPCTPKGAGTVTLDPAAGLATFEGGGYLECTFPDLPDMMAELSNGQLSLAPMQAYERFWMQAEATLDTSVNTFPQGNPLFSHPSMEYASPYDLATSQAFLRARVPGTLRASDPIALATGPSLLFAGHFPRNGADCAVRFKASGNPPSQRGFPCPAANRSVLFNVSPMTFYVGHSPAQGSYFYGDLHSLLVDPPNWGVAD